ncbi:unknown [[Mannheimia] succiniciproducens MBEL55E]|uniref:Uncharacterized protein n=1 Tax=Mannheimia succiniciproducens (strain KCTC 0769BP / MBEL55E) TaxID=221988 RepID=Q65RY8_MANSM|nr:unknown [[Mannheimia] succiniciproducens MBEL55E]
MALLSTLSDRKSAVKKTEILNYAFVQSSTS